jgi:hypothetical protein
MMGLGALGDDLVPSGAANPQAFVVGQAAAATVIGAYLLKLCWAILMQFPHNYNRLADNQFFAPEDH